MKPSWEKAYKKTYIGLLNLLFVLTIGYGRKNKTIPYFNETQTNRTFHVGEVAMFTCSIENLGPRTVSWRKASQPQPLTIGTFIYTQNFGVSVKHDVDRRVWRLFIENVRRKHSGVYECHVGTDKGLRKLFMLRVVGPDKPSFSKLEDVPLIQSEATVRINGTELVEIGQPIQLVCTATGSTAAPHGVEWFHEGERINPNVMGNRYVTKYRACINDYVSQKNIKRTKMTNYRDEGHWSIPGKRFVSTLTVEKSHLRDKGVYICRSSDAKTEKFRVDVINTASSNKRRGSEGDGRRSCGYLLLSSYHLYILLVISFLFNNGRHV